jgi:hypothetical protein
MPRTADPLRVIAPAVLAFTVVVTRPSAAQESTAAGSSSKGKPDRPSAESSDRFSVSGQSETFVQAYRRALVPGQSGQAVPTETAVPIHEYLFANARDVDTPWQKDALSLEFAAWGRVWPTTTSLERPFDGDVQTASVRLDAGPAWTRVGRQQMAGGAARYVRFDGITVGVRQAGFFAEGYGGFTVLPRWDARPGYHQLGKEEDTLVAYALPPPERRSHWLGGARAGYQTGRLSGSVSFHDEQVKGEVDHRNIGFDVGGQPINELSLNANLITDLDSGRPAEARFFVDATPHPLIDVGAEISHNEPALLLSRQSVLSVFSNDQYHEFGGNLTARPLSWLRVETNGYIETFMGDGPGSGPGARAEAALRFAWGRVFPTTLRVGYSRVIAPKNGYQGLRASFSRKLATHLTSTLEAYGYFYDEPVAGYRTSSVYAGTASYRVIEPLDLMWSASVARSPYASLDAQTMLRATLRFDFSSRPRSW